MTGGDAPGTAARLLLALRDPALWGAVSASACGYGDGAPWTILPLTLVLAVSMWLYGSPLVWRWLLGGAVLGRGDHAGVVVVASFSIVVIAYVGGDLLRHAGPEFL